MQQYKGNIKIVYRYFVVHPTIATLPALAACAAHRQGKFNQLKDLLWTKGYDAGRKYGRDNIEKLAKQVGLNMSKFNKDMDGDCKKVLQKDHVMMSSLGVSGTPSFFINGHFLVGAQPIGRFKTVIDAALKKANARISKGTKVADYYKTWVLNKGKKSL